MRGRLTIPLLVFFLACNKPDAGTIDTETLSRKLFDTLRNNDYDKSEILLPDKGTYRKIMEDVTQQEVQPSAYDTMLEQANKNFKIVHAMIVDWSPMKFQHAVSEYQKQGGLQFANTVVKISADTAVYKFSFTSCKYNSKWFYMGDLQPVNRE